MGLNIDLKNLRNNFISLLTLRLGNYIIPLLTLPFLIKVLGVEKFGLVAFAEMIIMYFKSIVDYGFDLTGTRSITESRGDKKGIDKLVNTIFGVKIILLVFCFLFLLLLIFIFPKLNNISLLLIFSYGIVLGNTLLPVWFFQGIEKMKYITIINFISKLVYIVLLFLLIKNESDYVYVPLLNGAGLVVGGLVSIFIMKRTFNVTFNIPKIKDILNRFKEDFNVFITTLAPNLYNNSMGVLLGVFTNNIQVGYYSAAIKLIEVGNSFIHIISTVIFPYLNRNESHRQKIINGTLISGFIISLLFFLFSEYIIILLFGNNMKESIIVLQLVSLSPFFISMMSIYGTNTLIIQKRDSLVRNIVLIYSLLGFVIGVFFIRYFGIIAAAIILVSIRGLIGFTEYLIVRNNFKKDV
jgi:PST family polysaccharide transporter